MALIGQMMKGRHLSFNKVWRRFSVHTPKVTSKNHNTSTVSMFKRTLSNVAGDQKSEPRTCPVNSYNEWDPLEEVIVGRIEALSPASSPNGRARYGGGCYPNDYYIKKAKAELEEFCNILRHEGVTVRRPEPIDFTEVYKTPDFEASAFRAGWPRDILLVVGNELIEAPMADRDRFFEYRAYRPLMKEYFKAGAKWTTAPKPQMSDKLYEKNYPHNDSEKRLALMLEGTFATTEFEPCFDAADFTRAGKDIFVQRSMVTNKFAIEWMRRHLGDTYKIHEVSFEDDHCPVHIDECLTLICPGLVLCNPEYPPRQLEMFHKAGWKTVFAPEPVLKDVYLPMASRWLAMNTLMLDPNRVVVERQEKPLQKMFEKLGIECVLVDFQHAYTFDGGFHCYTCDIRRKGTLESYF